MKYKMSIYTQICALYVSWTSLSASIDDHNTHAGVESDCKHGNICFNIRARGAASPLPRQIIINIITQHTHAGRALHSSAMCIWHLQQ